VELIVGSICRDCGVGNAYCSCKNSCLFEAFWLGNVCCPCMLGLC
jgi:hypothetical protein